MEVRICPRCDKLFFNKKTKYCGNEGIICFPTKEWLYLRKYNRKHKTRAGNSPKEYASFRGKVLYRDKWRCVDYGTKGNIVHHLKSVALFPELELVVSNGITLCFLCHRKRHPELSAGLFQPLDYLKYRNGMI